MADNKQVVIEFVGDTTKLNASVQELNTNLKQVSSNRFDEINKNFAILEQGAKKSGVGAKELSDRFKELGVSIPEEAMKEYATQIQDVAVKSVALRTQLANAKQALFDLAEQGKKGTKEWNEQVIAVEKLATKMQNLNKAVAGLGSSTKVLSGLIDGARGVAAGFQLATVGMQAFGGSTKENEKAIKTLVQSMAVLQALQEVQLLLEEESAAMQLILKGQRLAGAAAVQLQTLAESEYVIVSKAAAVAQWALNAAMNANPVLLLVGAIGAAVAALLYFTRGTEEANEETKKFNEELGKLDDTFQNSFIKRQKLTGELNDFEAKQLEINTEASKKSLAIIQEYEKKKNAIRGKFAPEKEFTEMQRIEEQRTQLLTGIEKNREVEIENERLAWLDKLSDEESDKVSKSEKKKQEERKKAQQLEIELAIRNIELKRNLELKGSEEDLALFKQVQQKKFELAKLGGAGLSELKTLLAEQKQAYDEYYGAILLTKSNADKEAMAQLKANYNDEQKFIEDFMSHKLEIEAAFDSMSFEDFKSWEEKKRKEYKETADAEIAEGKRALAEAIEKGKAEVEAANAEGKEKLKLKQLAFQKALEIAQEVSDAIFEIEKNNRDATLDAELSRLDRQKEKELSNKHLTEAQKDALNKKFHKLEADAKLKAWKADQKAAETQAAIKMALGVVNAWATSSTWVEALIRSAAVLAIGGIEIGIIASQKPPQFAEGTKGTKVTPPGFKWVGEKGPELLHEPGGAKIITHPDSMKILENYNLPAMPSFTPPMPQAPEMSAQNLAVIQQGIDYDKLGTVIAKKLRENPQTVVNLDKGGFSLYLIEKGRNVEKLNNRYEG